jgi:hypothetical protein
MRSPVDGVTPRGQCWTGPDPIPRTNQAEQQRGRTHYQPDSQPAYLKAVLARLSILILSKTYPGLGILKPITRLMKVW